MLLFAPPSRQKEIREKLNTLIHVPFKNEFSGSHIIFFDSEEDYSREEEDRAARSIQSFQEMSPMQVI